MFRRIEMPEETNAETVGDKKSAETDLKEQIPDEQDQIRKLKMEKAKTFLEKEGVIGESEGIIELRNPSKLSTKELHERAGLVHIATVKGKQLKLYSNGIIDFLLETEVKVPNGKGQLQPAVLLPKDRQSALNGDWNNNGVLDISKVRASNPWSKIIRLADGSELSYAELAIAKKLRDLRAKRNEQGELEIFDAKKNKYVPFSARSFVELSGINPCVTKRELTEKSDRPPGQKVEGRLQFRTSGALFSEKYLPNLMRDGVLRITDFSISAFGQSAELFRQNDKKFGGTNPYVYFANGKDVGARYYLGRTMIVGTETPITNDIVARQLDGQTVGIVDKSFGKRRLIYKFDLLSEEEAAQYHEILRQKFQGGDPNYKWLAMNTQVGGGVMKERIKEYKITDFVKQKNGEMAGNYAERVSRLSDVAFVTEKLQGFFRKAEIGLHRFPWRDQLLIADIVSVEKDETRLQNFAKKYGVSGLKTFLSLEFGRDIGKKILELGEILPEEQARLLFEKYAEVVSALSDLEGLIPEKERTPELVKEAEENLLRRARKIIEDFAEAQKRASKEGKVLDSEETAAQLSRISKENQSTLSVFKALQSENPWLTFKNFKDVQFGEEFIFDLEGEELKRMIEIYEKNYENTPRFQRKLIKNFGEIISKLSQPIQIIRYRGRIVGFYLYTPRKDGSLDFRCFNIDPAFAGGGFGKAMMNQELRERAFDNVVHATCTAESPIASEYIESGFVGIGYEKVDEINSLEIVRCDRRDFFSAKDPLVPNHQEFENLLEGKNEYKDDKYYIVSGETVDGLPFDMAGKEDGDSVFVLARYFRPDKQNKKYILVFERTDRETLKDYLNPVMERRGGAIVI